LPAKFIAGLPEKTSADYPFHRGPIQ
jgi:hypothetical protein